MPASDWGKIGTAMKFGQRIRQLRQSKGWTLRDLAAKVEVGFTYLSKVENEKLDCTDYPSEKLIRKLGTALDTDIDELMLLAEKVPDDIRERVMQRPDAFRLLANCDDDALDKVLATLHPCNSPLAESEHDPCAP